MNNSSYEETDLRKGYDFGLRQGYNKGYDDGYEDAKRELTGESEWVENEEGIFCSKCKTQICRLADLHLAKLMGYNVNPYKSSFCPECGAKMRKER